MGMPIRVVVSPKSLATGEAEISVRATGECKKVAYENVCGEIESIIKAQLDALNA